MFTALLSWIAESCPNWIKPVLGLVLLGIAGAMLLFGDVVWIGDFAIGAAMPLVGIATIKTGKDSGYNF